ncbi:hypothetical protein [Stieleria sedimenti]|uniref:hypothetical protein n=1 Tax=Stieleria sedimenti TaxID=2976331 RepID=UPI00217FBD51|nr:hypothetical protein [Stieleria sedimenti]
MSYLEGGVAGGDHVIVTVLRSIASRNLLMSITSINGEWQLERYHHLVDEIAWGDEADTACLSKIQAWLRGNGDAQIPDAVPMAGLVMKIQGNAFTEEAIEFDALMFDVSG